MRHGHGWYLGQAALMACVLVAVGSSARAASRGAAPPARPRTVPTSILITFGREGGNMLPLRVTIDAAGTVAVATSAPTNVGRPPVHLSQDALNGLFRLSVAEGFPAMPVRIIGHGLPDIGGRFIGMRIGGALKTVHVRFVRDRAFDELYAVLSATAGLPS